jgi:hypothetical protein
MTWQASLCERMPLLASRVGFLQGELRVYFRTVESPSPRYVLQLEQVASFYDSLRRGVEVRVTERPEHGSFGWWLPADDPHRSVQVTGVEIESGFLIALARRIVYRIADEGEAYNWPG